MQQPAPTMHTELYGGRSVRMLLTSFFMPYVDWCVHTHAYMKTASFFFLAAVINFTVFFSHLLFVLFQCWAGPPISLFYLFFSQEQVTAFFVPETMMAKREKIETGTGQLTDHYNAHIATVVVPCIIVLYCNHHQS